MKKQPPGTLNFSSDLRHRCAVVLGIVWFLFFVASPAVFACSCVWDPGGYLLKNGMVLPSNAQGIPWWGALPTEDPAADGKVQAPEPSTLPDLQHFSIARLDSEGGGEKRTTLPVTLRRVASNPWQEEVEASFTALVLVAPEGGLQPGTSYELTYNPSPGKKEWQQTIIVQVAEQSLTANGSTGPGDSSPGDSSMASHLKLAELREEKLSVETLGGSCAVEILAAQIGAELELPNGMERWRDALLYATRVNGETWRPKSSLCKRVPPGKSWVGPGRELLYADCTAPSQYYGVPHTVLLQGAHEVQMVAWLPGTDWKFESQGQFHLECSPPEPTDLQVTHLANEGFLIEGDGHRVLVDGLFDTGVEGYPTLPEEVRGALEQGQGRWAGVDVALATHFHRDHFDAQSVARFLAANPAAVFVSTPQAVDKLLAGPLADKKALQQRVRSVLPPPGEIETFHFDGIQVEVLHLHHGNRQPPVENLGFIVTLGSSRFLHFGDTEATLEDFEPYLETLKEVDVALLPFWFLTSRWRADFVKMHLRPRFIVGAHLPEPSAPAGHFGRWGSHENLLNIIRRDFPQAWLPVEFGALAPFSR